MKPIVFKIDEIGNTVIISKKDWERLLKWLWKNHAIEITTEGVEP